MKTKTTYIDLLLEHPAWVVVDRTLLCLSYPLGTWWEVRWCLGSLLISSL